MPRVKRGKNKNQKRKRILKKTKGYRHRKKSHRAAAKEALIRAGSNAYRDRKRKKREYRRQWQIVINAAAREHDISYSQFMGKLKENNISLNRKVLAEMAQHHPDSFTALVESVK